MTAIAVFLMCVALVWLGGIFYAVRKGLNELITGLSSIDQRLERLEALAVAMEVEPPRVAGPEG